LHALDYTGALTASRTNFDLQGAKENRPKAIKLHCGRIRWRGKRKDSTQAKKIRPQGLTKQNQENSGPDPKRCASG
jgi:hypothetical protein